MPARCTMYTPHGFDAPALVENAATDLVLCVAARGATVILGVRNVEAGRKVADQIK
jgi:hypothetical protein